jgi:hypothetical protein
MGHMDIDIATDRLTNLDELHDQQPGPDRVTQQSERFDIHTQAHSGQLPTLLDEHFAPKPNPRIELHPRSSQFLPPSIEAVRSLGGNTFASDRQHPRSDSSRSIRLTRRRINGRSERH